MIYHHQHGYIQTFIDRCFIHIHISVAFPQRVTLPRSVEPPQSQYADLNSSKLTSNTGNGISWILETWNEKALTVYPKKYAHGICFAVLCCGYTLTDLPISIRLTSLTLWQSDDCPSASKATLMNTDKYIIWIHYERLHNHNKAKHNKTVCIFLGIYCRSHLINNGSSLQPC